MQQEYEKFLFIIGVFFYGAYEWNSIKGGMFSIFYNIRYILKHL